MFLDCNFFLPTYVFINIMGSLFLKRYLMLNFHYIEFTEGL